jgi:hypothetical protein
VAQHGERPTIDLAAGRAVLAEDLPRVLRFLEAETPERLGWKQVDARTLLVSISGTHASMCDDYLLRLQFMSGREWPPSAQFINPETLDYQNPKDTHHLPVLEGTEVHVHPSYSGPNGPIQLICCSATFEYYEVLHGGEDRILWTASDDFLVTVNAIRRAMGIAYKGRQAQHVD